MNILKTDQIKKIKICGKILADSLDEVKKKVRPGITTIELDELAEKLLRAKGCTPAFKGYYVAGAGTFPSTLCVSINDEIVHGIPSEKYILKDGDIISLDIGAGYNGIYTDMATTVPVGKISAEAARLLKLTEESLYIGIKQAKAGNRIGDIGAEIEPFAGKHHLGLIRDYVGHGIGPEPHLPPQIPNFGQHNTGAKIIENMALAIEPMLTTGGEDTVVDDNGWTVRTTDGSLAAHFEHTIIIENGKPAIVTK
ncbi:type I methionyl aminopeptidase [Candidatus Berkelbacteria bacterium CG10_big_fil_rev_8_21_14_0_10_43_13]|uniref:Methionine aminopeptidase n=1 Tax=Candidatus Berkelbacteria bacterium CG10_big_fil_rev_8_21_14_0_10_43_13 TaxID=1974514 RepID=A0A2H0W647_9BACT|nr:MAG: type I methionyl aminopeptidase [Candidatus Berkelbacteria bacterium CG10_big_fil_rev_8_21_14_0_10_43_13]